VRTFWFSLLLGFFGADRFYLGSYLLGFIKAVSFGGFGVWWIIDLTLLLTNGIKDSDGRLVKMTLRKSNLHVS
jgi:TM2 domain-containing membrane protein YozV